MAAINFENLFNGLKTDVVTLATASFKTLATEAATDAQNLLQEMKEKLARWTILLAEKKLTPDDFELLINAQKDLIEMKVLQKAGLTAIRIEQFRDSVVNLVADSIFHVIGL